MLKADLSEFSLSFGAFFCLHGLIIKLLVSHHHVEQSYQTGIDFESCLFLFSQWAVRYFQENKVKKCYITMLNCTKIFYNFRKIVKSFIFPK